MQTVEINHIVFGFEYLCGLMIVFIALLIAKYNNWQKQYVPQTESAAFSKFFDELHELDQLKIQTHMIDFPNKSIRINYQMEEISLSHLILNKKIGIRIFNDEINIYISYDEYIQWINNSINEALIIPSRRIDRDKILENTQLKYSIDTSGEYCEIVVMESGYS